jgi:outer membrane protein TolC
MSNTSTRDYGSRVAQLLALALTFALLLATASAHAEPAPDAPLVSVVEALVQDARRANLELDIAGATAEERLAALDAARAHYLPVLALDARYSAADGGRTIDFPIGDLLNPVYASLNQLTGSSRFPSVPNQTVHLLRQREQDTHLTLTQPLYDARIAAGRDVSVAGLAGAQAAREALAGRIDRDMRGAYYRWLEAGERRGILEAALELARANVRVNQSLYANGKITPDLVYRADADLLEVQQTLLGARNAERLAQSYANLIRNAPFDRPLARPTVTDADIAAGRDALVQRLGTGTLALPALAEAAVGRRAELLQLDAATAAATAGERLARAAFKPQLALAVDAGTQGERYAFGSDDRYVLASLVLRFNLFDGGADEAGLAAARAVGRAARSQRTLAEQRIRLEVEQALDAAEVAMASLDTAARRVDAAKGAFHIAERKRDLGQINQAEFIDARRALTEAELNRNLTRYGALDTLAQLEYALGARRAQIPEHLP